MSTSRMFLIALFVILVAAIAVPAVGQTSCSVTVSWPVGGVIPYPFTTISAAVANMPFGWRNGVVAVSGVCTEPEISIDQRYIGLRLIGVPGTEATLAATPLSDPSGALWITGHDIRIQGLRITSAGAQYGVDVADGGTARIDGCVIEGFPGEGIGVVRHAFARIVNTTVRNNGAEGIIVHETSTARVGFTSTDFAVAPGNTILQNNATGGIRVNRTSSARIGNTIIAGNGDAGVIVENNSHADVASNELSGNRGSGIRVHLNSSARVGTGLGRADWDVPNWTTTPNYRLGVECSLGGGVEGRLGTLRGKYGPYMVWKGCVYDFTH